MPAISVIIPFYNSSEYIRHTLNSVLSQTLSDIEIICVDDGSTDRSAEIILGLRAEDNRIVYIKQENAGAGIARNNGIRHARGKYLAFMDSDDEYPSVDALEKLYLKAEENDVSICGGAMWEPEGSISSRQYREVGLLDFRFNQCIFWFSRFIYSRALLIENNCFFPPYRVFEDPIFLLKALDKAKAFYVIPESVYKINKRHTSAGVFSTQQLKDYLCALLDIMSISIRNNYKDVFQTCLFEIQGRFYTESINCLREKRADEDFVEMLFAINSYFGTIEKLYLDNELSFYINKNYFLYRMGQIRIIIYRIALKIFVKVPKKYFKP